MKTEIDQLIGKTGEGGLGPTTKRQLVEVQDELVRTLENQSPAYAEARRVFREASPEVDAIRESIIGTVARMDDTQVKNISRRLLDPAETNPQTVVNARKAIESVDPEGWNEILRVEFERRLGSIKPARGAAIQNQPGLLVDALFGNEKSRKVLMSALPNGQRETAAFLEKALRRAATGRPGGSPTEIRREFKKELGGPMMALRRWVTSPETAAGEAGADEVLRRRTAAISRVMFDPSYQADVLAIKKLKGQKAFDRMTELLTAAAAAETR